MKIQHNISLKPYNTFNIDQIASSFIRFEELQDVINFVKSGELKSVKYYILGGGSNILLTQDFDGLILHPDIKGIDIVSEDEKNILVKIGAGEVWEDFVEYTVDKEWYGIENLALIPGRVGAAPIQNIGAYGIELKDVFYELEAINLKTGELEIFDLDRCDFAYRSSFFKKKPGKYLICSVSLKLSKLKSLNLTYKVLSDYIANLKVDEITQRMVFEAVVAIRNSKLPKPEVLGNAGSFFKNPLVTNTKLESLKIRYPEIKAFEVDDKKSKLAAGWLIEKTGMKGYREKDAGVHDKQSLVLVNHGCATGKEIFELSEKIRTTVFNLFDVRLEREVNVL